VCECDLLGLKDLITLTQVRMDGLHTELEQGRQSQQQLKAHYVKRIEELHTQTEAYR
jgi:hypothetical protein